MGFELLLTPIARKKKTLIENRFKVNFEHSRNLSFAELHLDMLAGCSVTLHFPRGLAGSTNPVLLEHKCRLEKNALPVDLNVSLHSARDLRARRFTTALLVAIRRFITRPSSEMTRKTEDAFLPELVTHQLRKPSHRHSERHRQVVLFPLPDP